MDLSRALPAVLAAALVVTGCADDLAEDDPPVASPSPTAPPAAAPTTDANGDASAAAGSPAPGSFDAIPDIVQEVRPSVVSIQVLVEQQGRQGAGAGSGVIWDGDGHIVTNSHVVSAATDVAVVLASGERLEARTVAADARSDLAVLSVDRTGLPAATFADELPEVGELAIAMGNPLGLQNSATAGIVSGLGRSLPVARGVTLVDLIQTDAPISPGNSGGALVGRDGEVIGINVAQAGAQRAENLGFAIPSSTVISVVEELLDSGEVTRPYLGIQAATLTPQIAERFGIGVDAGAVVAAVEQGGPADSAGLRQGDVIVAIDDEPVEGVGDIAIVLRDHDPGNAVTVSYVREGAEQSVELTLGEMPPLDAG